MDDLDHSMHIAENDWTSFYEDSEECCLLQPLLACPDSCSLSDSEESGNLSSVFITVQQEPKQSSAATTGCSTEEESCTAGVKGSMVFCQSGTEGQDDISPHSDEAGDSRTFPGGGSSLKTKEVHVETADHVSGNVLQGEMIHVAQPISTEPEKDMQIESDTCDLKIPDPNINPLNVNEPHTRERAGRKDVSGVPLRAEKERWFVTVNDTPARRHSRAACSGKKKRRQKKPYKENHMCSPRQENSETEGEKDMEFNAPSNQTSEGHQRAPESFCVSSLPSSVSQKLLSPTNDNGQRSTMETKATHITFTVRDASKFGGVRPDEPEDSVELSVHGYDSESYLSAAESLEEPQHLLGPSDSRQLDVIENADGTQDRESRCRGGAAAAATGCEGSHSTGGQAYVESAMTSPSACQENDKTPNDNSTRDTDTRGALQRTPLDTPGLHKHKSATTLDLSASGRSVGGEPPLPGPDLPVTPSSVADSPETCAAAEGPTRPVYAISAFWDEMEKLTINDILQLKMARGPPHQKSPDVPTHSSSLLGSEEYHLCDGGLMDTSDTADSDYSTQADESKPDRSSCEFSTSDFDEDYWQFIGARRNATPDPRSRSQQTQRTTDSSGSAHEEEESEDDYEEEESTSSEGKETPVPLLDSAGQCFEDQNSNALNSGERAGPRQMRKSKSVRNVQALNTEDLSFWSVLGDEEQLRSGMSVEDNVVLEIRYSLGSLMPASTVSNTDTPVCLCQISCPEYFTKDKAEDPSRCVTVCYPEDLSSASVFEYTFGACEHEMSFSSIHDSRRHDGKPIPIFSCSPTVRELTFPKSDYVFLSADSLEEDEVSPIKTACHAFIQALGSRHGKGLLSPRKICFSYKGSIWCRQSGAWMFPVETYRGENPQIPVLREGRVPLASSQMLGELEVQRRILETIQATKQEGILSTLKHSDMCLLCIAFASWVLTSSDPEAADAWKTALLANVSALSAIQYLRRYVKKTPPPSNDP